MESLDLLDTVTNLFNCALVISSGLPGFPLHLFPFLSSVKSYYVMPECFLLFHCNHEPHILLKQDHFLLFVCFYEDI